MYFTTFYHNEEAELLIIHEFEPRQYAEDLATYINYAKVHRKPTPEEAEVIFRVLNGDSLSAAISSAKTEKITKD